MALDAQGQSNGLTNEEKPSIAPSLFSCRVWTLVLCYPFSAFSPLFIFSYVFTDDMLLVI